MPVLISNNETESEQLSEGVITQPLINKSLVGSEFIELDRWSLDEHACLNINILPTDLMWIQLLSGSALLAGNKTSNQLTTSHMVFLPPDYKGLLTAKEKTSILVGKVPNAAKYDPDLLINPPSFHCVNWRHEPVLDSAHDARKRIYLVTPTLFGTKAVKGEMIIYPPGTVGSNHHHEGAEHFQYMISGRGTAYLSEKPVKIEAGDTLYNYENERHYFINDSDQDMVFVEYFVPADCKTVWVDEQLVCAWLPSGQNIDGGKPVRHIDAHSSAETVNPEGV